MPAPTFAAEYETAWDTTTTPKTDSVTVAVGDVLVVCAQCENNSGTLSTPTGGTGFTWTLKQSYTNSTNVTMSLWTTVATVAQTFTLSNAKGGSAVVWGRNAFKFTGTAGIGTGTAKAQSSGAPSLAITTGAANSAIVVFVGDYDAIDGTTRTWRTVNSITPTIGGGDEKTYYRGPTTYTVYGAYYSDAGAAGSKTVGLTLPSTMKYGIMAVEVLAGAGGTTHTKSQTDPVGITDAATAVQSAKRGPADTISATDAAAAIQSVKRTITDQLGISDDELVVVENDEETYDPVGIGDSTERSVSIHRLVTDVVGLVDAAARAASMYRLTTDEIDALDTLALDRGTAASDDVGLSDTVEVALTIHVEIDDAIGISDSLAIESDVPLTYTMTVTDLVGVTDEVETDLTGAPVTYTMTVTDLVGISDDVNVPDDSEPTRRTLVAIEMRFTLAPVADRRTLTPVSGALGMTFVEE